MVLSFFWLIGFLLHLGGGLIHNLVIVVLVLIVFNLLTGRGPESEQLRRGVP